MYVISVLVPSEALYSALQENAPYASTLSDLISTNAYWVGYSFSFTDTQPSHHLSQGTLSNGANSTQILEYFPDLSAIHDPPRELSGKKKQGRIQ